MGTTRTVAIVDGYSTGNFLVPEFGRLGVAVVHVQGSDELIPSMVPPDLAACAANVVRPDLDPDRLARHRPGAVVAGSEIAVPLADWLAGQLGLPGNDPASSVARRDKFTMIETLRAAGIRCAAQHQSADVGEIRAWARDNGYPVVVKPRASASTQNVMICADDTAVATAAREVLDATTMFGERNSSVLVQSFLAGPEYIVDSVSSAGHRHVCGVWEYVKSRSGDGRPRYELDVLADPDSAEVAELVEYSDTALRCLGILHGPAHAEVIRTPDGPALVEVGARLNGNLNPGCHDRATGANQAGLTALAAARPEEFRRRYGGTVYRRLAHAVVYNTRTDRSGIVESVDQSVVDAIAALPSVHLVVPRLAPGARMRPTVDLLTSPMRIFLVNPDEQALQADRKAIDDLKDSVYRVVAP